MRTSIGAGDQGHMFGYSTDQTPELMPLSHALTNHHRGLQEWHGLRAPAEASRRQDTGHRRVGRVESRGCRSCGRRARRGLTSSRSCSSIGRGPWRGRRRRRCFSCSRSPSCRRSPPTTTSAASWSNGGDYSSWASDKTIRVGDTVTFQYVGGMHSVDEVNKADYDACSTSSTLSSDGTVNTVITLSQPGTRYFVCGTSGHCGGGMKLTVPVSAAAALLG